MSAPHDRLTDELRARVEEYSLHQLAPATARAFEEHVAQCPVCAGELRSQQALLGAVALAAPPVEPRAGLRDELLARVRGRPSAPAQSAPNDVQVWKQWKPAPGSEAGPIELLRRAGEGAFEPTGVAGVTVRRLYVDPARDRGAMMVRMEAGTSYPAHRHGGTEECYVLSGDLRIGERVMKAGDFEVVQRDSVHAVQSTREGCLLLICSSLSDELLPG